MLRNSSYRSPLRQGRSAHLAAVLRLQPVACCLLAAGCCLLAVGCCLLAVGCWLLAGPTRPSMAGDTRNRIIIFIVIVAVLPLNQTGASRKPAVGLLSPASSSSASVSKSSRRLAGARPRPATATGQLEPACERQFCITLGEPASGANGSMPLNMSPSFGIRRHPTTCSRWNCRRLWQRASKRARLCCCCCCCFERAVACFARNF